MRSSIRAAVIALTIGGSTPCAARDDERQPISDAVFDRLHALIRPQRGESRWMEIDWYPSVWEARRRAAAEGKPIFLMAGSGGAPAAGC